MLSVLKSYYDQSGQLKDRFMTLAGIAASDLTWSSVEDGWRSILAGHKPSPNYLHMVEANGLRGEFSRNKGWTDTGVNELVSKLLVYLSAINKGSYYQVSGTVNMEDYKKLQAENYQMPSPVELCIKACVDRIRAWYIFRYQGLDLEASFYFDRNEPFEPVFKATVAQEQGRDKRSGNYSIWSHIVHVGPSSREKTPGLQVADLLAWSVNRNLNEASSNAHIAVAMKFIVGAENFVWNERNLRKIYRP